MCLSYLLLGSGEDMRHIPMNSPHPSVRMLARFLLPAKPSLVVRSSAIALAYASASFGVLALSSPRHLVFVETNGMHQAGMALASPSQSRPLLPGDTEAGLAPIPRHFGDSDLHARAHGYDAELSLACVVELDAHGTYCALDSDMGARAVLGPNLGAMEGGYAAAGITKRVSNLDLHDSVTSSHGGIRIEPNLAFIAASTESFNRPTSRDGEMPPLGPGVGPDRSSVARWVSEPSRGASAQSNGLASQPAGWFPDTFSEDESGGRLTVQISPAELVSSSAPLAIEGGTLARLLPRGAEASLAPIPRHFGDSDLHARAHGYDAELSLACVVELDAHGTYCALDSDMGARAVLGPNLGAMEGGYAAAGITKRVSNLDLHDSVTSSHGGIRIEPNLAFIAASTESFNRPTSRDGEMPPLGPGVGQDRSSVARWVSEPSRGASAQSNGLASQPSGWLSDAYYGHESDGRLSVQIPPFELISTSAPLAAEDGILPPPMNIADAFGYEFKVAELATMQSSNTLLANVAAGQNVRAGPESGVSTPANDGASEAFSVDIRASAGFESNPFQLDAPDPDSASLRARIEPTYTVTGPRGEVRVNGRLEHIQYARSYGSLQNFGAGIASKIRLNPRFEATIDVGFDSAVLAATDLVLAQFDETLGDSSVGIPTTDITLLGLDQRRDQFRAQSGLRFVLSERDELTMTGSFQTVRFNGEGLQDSDLLSAQLGYVRQVSRGFGIGAVVGVSEFEFLNSTFADLRTISPQVRFVLSVSPEWEMSGDVGISIIESQINGLKESSTAFAADLSLCYRVVRDRLCIDGSRQVLPTGIGGASLQSVVGASYAARLSERDTLDLGGAFSTTSAPVINVGNDFESVRGFARYERQLNERLNFFGSVAYSELSTGSGSDRRNFQALAGLRIRLGGNR